jgi:hypothetical protein
MHSDNLVVLWLFVAHTCWVCDDYLAVSILSASLVVFGVWLLPDFYAAPAFALVLPALLFVRRFPLLATANGHHYRGRVAAYTGLLTLFARLVFFGDAPERIVLLLGPILAGLQPLPDELPAGPAPRPAEARHARPTWPDIPDVDWSTVDAPVAPTRRRWQRTPPPDVLRRSARLAARVE